MRFLNMVARTDQDIHWARTGETGLCRHGEPKNDFGADVPPHSP